MSVLARAFFALHDTKTPVIVSFIGLFILVVGDFTLVKGLHLGVWALAASFALSTIVEAIILLILINKRIERILNLKFVIHVLKILGAALISGSVMYFILKIFDKSVWIKRLSFLSGVDVARNFPFEKFMLDTRYTGNVLILTVITFLIGIIVYVLLSLLFRIEEATYFLSTAKKLIIKRTLPPIPPKEQEPITPSTDVQTQ
jgi:putative peptidoglycan lipid II flippase